MTIGGWIAFGVIVSMMAIIGVALYINAESIAARICIVAVVGVAAIALLFGMRWFFNNTEKGKRAFKTQESNLGGGLEREINVYDMEGDLIATYSGKFDVTHDNSRILFDDENGKRHTIYYSTGTVTIDEK